LNHAPSALVQAINDEDYEVATMASEALCYLGYFDLGVEKLIYLFKNNFNPAYSSLETLTWYPEQKKLLKKYIPAFQNMVLQQSKIKQDRMSLGVKIRSILINLEALPLNNLYSDYEKAEGVKKNKKGRSFVYPNTN